MAIRIFVTLLFLFNSSFQISTQNSKRDLRILFIGNSLTYYNDLPELVKEIAAHDDVKISIKQITKGGYSLEDHFKEGLVQQEIRAGKYDYVILQQGPSALPESQILLLEYATKFADLCKESQATMALYMVWPSEERLSDLDNVIYSYTQASLKTKALLLPAGLAWKNAWAVNKSTPLYGADHFHPGMTGSVLAALTIYGAIRKNSDFKFIDYEKISWHKKISSKDFDVLKRSAVLALVNR